MTLAELTRLHALTTKYFHTAPSKQNFTAEEKAILKAAGIMRHSSKDATMARAYTALSR
jgi:hypothetical protein